MTDPKDPNGAPPSASSTPKASNGAPPDSPVAPLQGKSCSADPSPTAAAPGEHQPPPPSAEAQAAEARFLARQGGWKGPPGAQGRPRGVLNGQGKSTHNPRTVHWWYERLADWMIANPHLSMKDAALAFGKSHYWILQLKNSDTFQRFWRERSGAASVEFVGGIKSKAFAAAEASLDLLNDKLEEAPQSFTVNGLLDVVDTTMKRFGYEPPARPGATVNVNVGLVSPQELQEARARMRDARGHEVAPGDRSLELLANTVSEEEKGD